MTEGKVKTAMETVKGSSEIFFGIVKLTSFGDLFTRTINPRFHKQC